ncbi:hypothetical protein HYQ46_006631 [Verticillium longisporum]|nr:hypothetical protein HYQ46_006631 [Verticillium longisporum]
MRSPKRSNRLFDLRRIICLPDKSRPSTTPGDANHALACHHHEIHPGHGLVSVNGTTRGAFHVNNHLPFPHGESEALSFLTS